MIIIQYICDWGMLPSISHSLIGTFLFIGPRHPLFKLYHRKPAKPESPAFFFLLFNCSLLFIEKILSKRFWS